MSEREAIAKWMIANSLATGHGDTVDDLLSEAAGQIAELRARVAKLEAALERIHPHICAFGSDEELAVVDAALSETVKA